MLGFEDVGAYVGGFLYAHQFLCGNGSYRRAGTYLSYVIESEGALALNIVVSPIIERVVLADQDLKAKLDITLLEQPLLAGTNAVTAPRQLDRRQLFLIVFFECWSC